VTPDELVNVAMGPLVVGAGVALGLSILGGLTFWALDLVRALWGGGRD
jgi:hypothetical protein